MRQENFRPCHRAARRFFQDLDKVIHEAEIKSTTLLVKLHNKNVDDVEATLKGPSASRAASGQDPRNGISLDQIRFLKHRFAGLFDPLNLRFGTCSMIVPQSEVDEIVISLRIRRGEYDSLSMFFQFCKLNGIPPCGESSSDGNGNCLCSSCPLSA